MRRCLGTNQPGKAAADLSHELESKVDAPIKMMGPIANFSRRKFSKGNGCAIVEMAAVIFPHKGKGLASELDVLFNGTKSLLYWSVPIPP